MSRPSPILIWGAGAMGASIGASLVKAGTDVLFVDRDEDHVAAMNTSGLRITGPVDEGTVRVRAATPDMVEGPFELCLLCVKSQDTETATDQLAALLAADGAVVSIQNGLCEHVIAERIGHERTIGAFVNFGADYLEPGVVHRGNRGATVVGELDGTMGGRIRAVHRLLQLFEPDAVLTPNIFGYLWGKLAYGSLLFATALTNDPIADVLADESLRPTLIGLAREAVAVAEAEGVRVEGFDGFEPAAFAPEADPARAADSLDGLVRFNRGSAKTHTGVWRDLAVRHRKTEVDAQLGWIVTIGERHGVPTPLNRELIEQIHEIEDGRRAFSRDNVAEIGAPGETA